MANYGDGMIDVAVLVALVMGAANANRLQPVIQHNSELTGDKYFREIVATENVHRFREVARMDKETFVKFIALLGDIGGLHNSMYICTGQMAMIFCQVLRGHTSGQHAFGVVQVSLVVELIHDTLPASFVVR